MGTVKNFYPPEIKEYLVVFSTKDSVRINLNISRYNTINEINTDLVQVIVKDQFTNLDLLDSNVGLRFTKLQFDGQYYIVLNKNDFDGGEIKSNTFLKLQIRFTTADTFYDGGIIPSQSWINQNLDNFSEWSKVCLLKLITEPTLAFGEIEPYIGSQPSKYYSINSQYLNLAGRVEFDEEIDETLEGYSVSLFDITSELTLDQVYSTGYQYSDLNDRNAVSFNLPYELINGHKYIVAVYIKTKNGYEKIFQFPIIVIIEEVTPPTGLTANLILDKNNGIINIQIIPNNITDNRSYLIKRADSKDNFAKWTTVYCLNMDGEPPYINEEGTRYYLFNDYSIESGIWYKYRILITNGEQLGPAHFINEEPVMLELECAFLNRGTRQLKLVLDNEISSLKKNRAENKIDTIGSKYPFISKNGYMDYYEFSLSGTISFIADEDELFIKKEQFYKDNQDIYDDYFLENRITDISNSIYERFYREQVIEFLNDGREKLFRSNTEGNMIVRLMNINLSPNNQLGRHIYKFSAQCYEMADCTIENLDKYDIQEIPSYVNNTISRIAPDTTMEAETSLLGDYTANTNIVNILKSQIIYDEAKYDLLLTGISSIIFDFNTVQEDLYNEPCLQTSYGEKIYINNIDKYLELEELEVDENNNLSLSFDKDYTNLIVTANLEYQLIEREQLSHTLVTIREVEVENKIYTIENTIYTYQESFYNKIPNDENNTLIITQIKELNAPIGTVVEFKYTDSNQFAVYYLDKNVSNLECKLQEGRIAGKWYMKNSQYADNRLDISKIDLANKTYNGHHIVRYMINSTTSIDNPTEQQLNNINIIVTNETVENIYITVSYDLVMEE